MRSKRFRLWLALSLVIVLAAAATSMREESGAAVPDSRDLAMALPDLAEALAVRVRGSEASARDTEASGQGSAAPDQDSKASAQGSAAAGQNSEAAPARGSEAPAQGSESSGQGSEAPPQISESPVHPPASPVRDTLPPVRITFLDVGQADAVLIQTPEGRTALVDAGRRSPVGQLRRLGVTAIDLLVATHAHADHIGGMAAVIEEIPVGNFMDNAKPHTTRTYERLMSLLERYSNIVYLRAVPRRINLGRTSIDVLPMSPDRSLDQNNRSVALVVRHGNFSAFLSGDSEIEQLNYLVGRSAVPRITLMKAPHHGSRDAFSDAFVSVARPQVVVISVGRNNRYGHPSPEVVRKYSSAVGRVYRTDRDGAVTVLGFSDGSHEVRVGAAAYGAWEGGAGRGAERGGGAGGAGGEGRPRASGGSSPDAGSAEGDAAGLAAR